MFTREQLAQGLHSEICSADPVIDGEEYSVMETEASGSEILIGLEDESGRTYSARLVVVEVWAD